MAELLGAGARSCAWSSPEIAPDIVANGGVLASDDDSRSGWWTLAEGT